MAQDTAQQATPNSPAEAAETTGLLNVPQAAKRLGLSVRTTWQLIYDRELTAVRIGRSCRLDPADLAAFIESRKVRARGWKGA